MRRHTILVTETAILEKVESLTTPESPWSVIIWDDPVNTMEYVSKVLQRQFGFSRERSEELMLKAHNEGKAAVWSGSKNEAEAHCVALHSWGIQSTVSGS